MKRLWDSSFVRFVREMGQIYFDKRVDSASAALAYFLILSFFPLLIGVNAFIGLLRIDPNSVLHALSSFLPQEMLGVVEEYLGYITVNESPGLLAAGAVVTLFFASGAMRTLMNTMDDIYGRRGYRGFFRVAASVVFSVLLLAAMYLSMAVVLTGGWFFGLLERFVPAGWPRLLWAWRWLKFALLFGVVFVLVTVVYLMAAPPGKPRTPVFLGAFLASVALVAASLVFSLFIGMSSRYSLIYGSLASLIILFLWLYLCGNVLILGNIFNCVRLQRKKEKKSEENA